VGVAVAAVVGILIVVFVLGHFGRWVRGDGFFVVVVW